MRLIDDDTLDLIKRIIDSYEYSPIGIFCREVAITERDLEAIKVAYDILKEGKGEIMEKRKLSQFEQIILASAYNLKNYCKNTSCSNCLFRQGVSTCILTTPDNPYNWELYQINREEGEAE